MKALVFLKLYRTFKTEILVVLISIGVLILLPVLSVVVVANAGIQQVSDAIVSVNPETHKVDIRDPEGNIVTSIEATTTWPVCGYISEPFGVPHWPWQEYHTGIDIANPNGEIGDSVTPFMEGKVTKIEQIDNGGYGKYVTVDHGNNISSLYGHLTSTNATEGQEVVPGDVIGYEGSTGTSTGPHVHFEIRVYGVLVDPEIFMTGKPLDCYPRT